MQLNNLFLSVNNFLNLLLVVNKLTLKTTDSYLKSAGKLHKPQGSQRCSEL